MAEPILAVDGEVNHELALTFEDLVAFEEAVQVRGVSGSPSKWVGDGVTLESLLSRVEPTSAATYLTLHAAADDFAASLPLEAVRGEAVVVYCSDGGPLSLAKGGPLRFLIPDPAACHTDELDDCANVKFLDRIELTAGRGRDTRPTDEDEHEELHRRQQRDDA